MTIWNNIIVCKLLLSDRNICNYITEYKQMFIRPIGIMVRVFANGPRDLGLIPGRVIPKTQKWYLMPPYLTLNIIRYRSRVSGENQEKEYDPLLHLGIVAIEKWGFGSLSTMIGQLYQQNNHHHHHHHVALSARISLTPPLFSIGHHFR